MWLHGGGQWWYPGSATGRRRIARVLRRLAVPTPGRGGVTGWTNSLARGGALAVELPPGESSATRVSRYAAAVRAGAAR